MLPATCSFCKAYCADYTFFSSLESRFHSHNVNTWRNPVDPIPLTSRNRITNADLRGVLCRPALCVRTSARGLPRWKMHVCVCVCVRVDIVRPTESIKEIIKMCVASLTVARCWSSECYGCHYQIAKLTGHVTHHPTQTAHSKQRR